ncbi:hypothetical protein C8R44DRAFT_736691 [Mycena epipterygia]|nr:hypothetical protein C8R44DRAFT_736691 [Mycena epipterygia]
MAAFFPLAALTLLATASVSGPASVLFRAVRRVVQPAPAEMPPEDGAAADKGEFSLSALFLPAFTFLFASLSRPAALLPVFRTQDKSAVPGAEPVFMGLSLCEENTLVDGEESKADGGESGLGSAIVEVESEEPDADADATPIRIAPPPYTRRPVQPVPPPCRAYVDFTIGWDDVWPERHCGPGPRVKYTYNSYFNAYTYTVPQESFSLPLSPSPQSDCRPADSDDDSSDDEDDAASEAALELASRSADDDLIWALQALSISDQATPPTSETTPYPAFSEVKSPPAGMSPFCPPPPPTPAPPQSAATTWRLEWY